MVGHMLFSLEPNASAIDRYNNVTNIIFFAFFFFFFSVSERKMFMFALNDNIMSYASNPIDFGYLVLCLMRF